MIKIKPELFWVMDYYPDQGLSKGEYYDQVAREIEIAEKLGFRGVWIAEHHFIDYGIVPNSPIYLSHIATRTKSIRIGPAVSTIVFRNPIQVAEDYSLLDVLSNGRVNLAVGSGYLKHEFAGFNVSQEYKREIFDEALDIILKLMKGEKITVNGKYFKFDNIGINVLPVQKPHPPIWIAVLRAEAAYHVGKKGFNLMMIPYATIDKIDDIKPVIDSYREGLKEVKGSLPEISLAFHAHVSSTFHSAVEENKEYIHRYVFSRLYAKRRTLDELYNSGLLLLGSPEDVANQICKIWKLTEVNRIMFLVDYGMKPFNLVAEILTDIREKVNQKLERKGIELDFAE
ncbi:MAG: LLM class flavin-dependent oxidoreductase [Saccharolobus sp.]|uniref:Alkanal monooxygenase alpha chain n=2 Tax=Saccharolobus shibatae TaxID=2286 RepID=A0A8F5GZ72_9CREN|nr:LLM class flavin-dependent oxidoreductase [Saccharolobus shibatae]MCH4816664.1 LLM class flavin-dependent oxidoreductase [Saccharolobus shibatae]QXJ28451.1 Alkanal monooxygenase alpha chain [Saccharolobus shibatae B12]QXJ31780.1 Alkanal monooxygenase alpha chain [Saccharolobus shibatae]QXJ34801.1 Alkanal monooxygenase alpha chain [Saccharolobus shibatae]